MKRTGANFLGGRLNQVMAGTALTIAALHGGLEASGNAHGWRVDGDYVPAAINPTSTTKSVVHEREQREDEAYLVPPKVKDPEEEQTCVIPATAVTRIERTTSYNDWTLPYGVPIFFGGMLVALAADNKQRQGVVLTEGTRNTLAYVGVLTGIIATAGFVTYELGDSGILSTSSYREDTVSTTTLVASQPTAKSGDEAVTTIEFAPSTAYDYGAYHHDPCAGADRKVVRVTDKKTVTYRDGRPESN